MLIIEAGQQHMRLDVLLRSIYKHTSREYFQHLIDGGLVLVNGALTKKSYKPDIGDEVELQFVVTEELPLLPENIPLDILFEDEHMIAVNKPAGLVVHPAFGNWTGTLVNALLYHCQSLEKHDAIRPGIVHRLDKDTSGVIIAAKSLSMHQALCRLFASRKIEKTYVAICLGKPKACTITAPIGRHPVYRKQMTVLGSDGKEAITHVQPMHTNGKLSFVRIALETGRTHQIRVHMKHIGHHILGDQVYGIPSHNEHYGVSRQLLHADQLAFVHPFTNESLVIKAPLPADIEQFVFDAP